MAANGFGTFASRFKRDAAIPYDAPQTASNTQRSLQDTLVLGGLAIIALHLTNVLLFHAEVPSFGRLLWAIVTLGVAAGATYFYRSFTPALRGVVALAFGLPAMLAGLGIYVVHIVQIGFEGHDYTGIPTLVAGLLLTGIGTTILTQLIRSWWRRLLLIPVALVFTGYVLFPVALGIATTNLAALPICCDDTPATRGFAYEDVTFKTEDGLTLGAWYIPSKNRAAVITVHGAGRGRDRTINEAAVLAKHGYGVLMIDIEGFGESEGRFNAFGWVGARDVHAAVDYLQTRSDIDPDKIGGLGLSMGGEVLIQAAGESDELKAIVSEGGSSRTPDDLDEMPGTTFAMPMQWTLSATLQLITGESPPPPLKQMVRQIGPRDVLLISADEKEERTLNRLYKEVGGASFDHWEVPSSKHIGALKTYPEEYEQRVISFFDESFAIQGD